MRSNRNEFAIGQLVDLSYSEVEGHAAELTHDQGDVFYRGCFVATMFNDEGGGDVLDQEGQPMSDEQVQARIDVIDTDCEGRIDNG